jgi:hypothetical protein
MASLASSIEHGFRFRLAGLIATYSLVQGLRASWQMADVHNQFFEMRQAAMWWPAMWWPGIQAALAAACGIALYYDSVALAFVCALSLLGVSLITVFGAGFHVVIPAAGLVLLITLYSQREASRPRTTQRC